jgi:hypothetical protein
LNFLDSCADDPYIKAQWVVGEDAVICQVQEGEPNEEEGQERRKEGPEKREVRPASKIRNFQTPRFNRGVSFFVGLQKLPRE